MSKYKNEYSVMKIHDARKRIPMSLFLLTNRLRLTIHLSSVRILYVKTKNTLPQYSTEILYVQSCVS